MSPSGSTPRSQPSHSSARRTASTAYTSVDNSPNMQPTELHGTKSWPLNNVDPVGEMIGNAPRQAWVEDVTDKIEIDPTQLNSIGGVTANADIENLFGEFFVLPASWPPNLPSPCTFSPPPCPRLRGGADDQSCLNICQSALPISVSY